MHTFRHWKGVVGEIRWHSFPAAAVNGWTVSRTPAGVLQLRGTVVLSDAFKLAQRPLRFVAPVRLGPPESRRDAELVWAIDTFTLRDGLLEAQLLPPLKGTDAALPIRRPDPRSPAVLV